MRPEIAVLADVVARAGRIAIVGASGSGKTATLRELLRELRRQPLRVIAFDPHHQLGLLIVRTRAEAAYVLQGPYGRVAADNSPLWCELARMALGAGGALLVADECQTLVPSTGKMTEARALGIRISTEGRHAGCPWIWASQTPGRVDLALSENTDARVVGRLCVPTSISRAALWDIPREAVATLPDHVLLLSRPGHALRSFRSRPYHEERTPLTFPPGRPG